MRLDAGRSRWRGFRVFVRWTREPGPGREDISLLSLHTTLALLALTLDLGPWTMTKTATLLRCDEGTRGAAA